uniref:Secreted protein n=1 Tax=Thraustotheca clavata TaxID=74557 RepID=A0A0A7CMI5_9STRA|nr:secreted protein [Thraustotheca clavata]
MSVFALLCSLLNSPLPMRVSFLIAASSLAIVNADADCTMLTIAAKTSKDGSCDGSLGTHNWPINVEATYCHGWSQVDGDGKVTSYSANNIKCDVQINKFTFTQYEGVTDCSGSAKDDDLFSQTCAVNPQKIYTQAMDFTCCDQRSSSFGNCNTGLPNITYPAGLNMTNVTIYQNGEVCLPAANITKIPTQKPTKVPKTPTITTPTPLESAAVATTVPVATSSGNLITIGTTSADVYTNFKVERQSMKN